MVEVGAVVHAGADDGQAQRDIDALHSLPLLLLTVVDEADGLEGDMALIVVHADHDVVPAADGLRENAVRRAGADNAGDALGLGSLDGRGDLLDLLAAEQAVLAAVGVQAGHCDAGVLDAHILAGLIGDLDDFQHTLFLDPVAGFAQGDVGGDVDHAQVVVGQHHGVLLGVGVGGVNLGVAVEMGVAVRLLAVIVFQSLVHGFLVQGVGAGSIHLTGHGKLDDLLDALEGCVAALHAHLCHLELVDVLDEVEVQHVDGSGGEQSIRHLVAAVDDDVLTANELPGPLEHLHVAHNDGAAVGILLRICQSLDGDLRAGAGGIAHRNANDRFIHSSALLALLSSGPWQRSRPGPS